MTFLEGLDDIRQRLAELVAGLIAAKPQPPLATLAAGTGPTGPAIAAESTKGVRGLGHHATVWLARRNGAELCTYQIDVFVNEGATSAGTKGGNPPSDSPLAKGVGAKLFGTGGDSGEILGLRVRIREHKDSAWADPSRSRTWTLTDGQAEAAYTAALDRQTKAQNGDYFYSFTGLGGGYNCAGMAAEIVRTAGVDATSGLVFDTAGELALGSKLPDERLQPDPPNTRIVCPGDNCSEILQGKDQDDLVQKVQAHMRDSHAVVKLDRDLILALAY
jgi:hypothetical protein